MKVLLRDKLYAELEVNKNATEGIGMKDINILKRLVGLFKKVPEQSPVNGLGEAIDRAKKEVK